MEAQTAVSFSVVDVVALGYEARLCTTPLANGCPHVVYLHVGLPDSLVTAVNFFQEGRHRPPSLHCDACAGSSLQSFSVEFGQHSCL